MSKYNYDLAHRIQKLYQKRIVPHIPLNEFEANLLPRLESIRMTPKQDKKKGLDPDLKADIINQRDVLFRGALHYVTIDDAIVEFDVSREVITNGIEAGYITPRTPEKPNKKVTMEIAIEHVAVYLLGEYMYNRLKQANAITTKINPITGEKYEVKINLRQARLGKTGPEIKWEVVHDIYKEMAEIFDEQNGVGLVQKVKNRRYLLDSIKA